MADFDLKGRTRNFLSAGVNLLHHVATVGGRNDSSDDEKTEQGENEDYITKGTRGVVVFHTFSVRTKKPKYVHVHLYSGTITQYYQSRKKVYQCSNIVNITRNSETLVTIEYPGIMEVQYRTKKFFFESESSADKFQQYIECLSEMGKFISQAFDSIDYTKSGKIARDDLELALARCDLNFSPESIERMIHTGLVGHQFIDFVNFFHLFFGKTYVISERECLLEWYHLANETSGETLYCSAAPAFTLLPGEIVIFFTSERVYYGVYPGKYNKATQCYYFPGTMYLTNYRLVFQSSRKNTTTTTITTAFDDISIDGNSTVASSASASTLVIHSRYDIPAYFHLLSLPLNAIYKVNMKHNLLIVQGKDLRTIHLRLMMGGCQQGGGGGSQLESIYSMIHSLTYLQNNNFTPTSMNSLATNASIISNSAASDKLPASHTLSTSTPSFPALCTLEDFKNHFFAYRYVPTGIIPYEQGWNITDLIKEYVRQGLFSTAEWRVLDNSDYSLSDTYPRHIAVPRKLSPEQIKAAANHRSKNRFPVITYSHHRYLIRGRTTSESMKRSSYRSNSTESGPESAPVLCRSAQPLVGITNKGCSEDEMLLNLYRLKGKVYPPEHNRYTHSKLYIVDARGRVAATLNMAAGKGTEDVSLYCNAQLLFGNIDNIHVMRHGLNTLTDNLGQIPHPYTPLEQVIAQEEDIANSLHNKLAESHWWKHIRLLLSSSIFIAEKLHLEQASVLVHCSDGWDRTAQLCAIAQLLLDPYYRTIEGFAVLIEKDWCAFGHKFQDRVGHAVDITVLPDERSPVFLQFLETVFQLLVQFPSCFEFTDSLLVFIADHVVSGLFGNFFGNTDQERKLVYCVQENTQSIWSYVLTYRSHFANSQYVLYEGILWPKYTMNVMKVWERYWLRYDINSHPNILHPDGPWQDDWGDAFLSKSS